MLDIVVCSKNNNLMERSINIINATLVNYEIDYHIHKFSSNNKKLGSIIKSGGSKIYILDIEIGIEIASLIRKEDFDSIIIFISSKDKFEESVFNYSFMALDYMPLDNDFCNRFRDNLKLCFKIIYGHDVLVFKYNHVTYRIPYADIIYIEKEPQIKRCIIHTSGGIYHVVNSIEKLSKLLKGPFIRTHQACIVNVANVYCVDFINNVIVFNNGEKTSLIAEKKKKAIRELVGSNN